MRFTHKKGSISKSEHTSLKRFSHVLKALEGGYLKKIKKFLNALRVALIGLATGQLKRIKIAWAKRKTHQAHG
jgi:hypothetical protein